MAETGDLAMECRIRVAKENLNWKTRVRRFEVEAISSQTKLTQLEF